MAMQLLYTGNFKKTRLNESEKQRCFKAVNLFQRNPRHPGLKFERLGSGGRNHCSIRASKELRIILAVYPDFQDPGITALFHMDHHDPAYAWSEKRGFNTDMDWMAGSLGTSGFHEKHTGGILALEPNAGKSLAEELAKLDGLAEWQLFLHPKQRVLVQRRYRAAARFRGGAGTGKTVIGLHRAVELGNRYRDGRILFTTFSRSLTDHLGHLFSQIPNAPENVDFINIDLLAKKIAPEQLKVDFCRSKSAFKQAFSETVSKTPLAAGGEEYLKDEIVRIIKGRGATREQYLDTGKFQRLGRRRTFKRRDREQCWMLREAWDRYMAQAGVVDFADILIEARDRARENETPPYRAAIVDEAQDMTVVGLELVRALVCGAPGNPMPSDGVLILDDLAQQIYKGGILLRWSGLDVKGRSEVLTMNYRNTEQVLAAARAIRGTELSVKDEEDDGAAWPERFELEEGPNPVFLSVKPKGEIPAIAHEINNLIQKEQVAPEAIAILTTLNMDVESLVRTLGGKLSIPCANLKDQQSGRLDSGVRVGTFDRGKGMEFEAVFIPRLGSGHFPRLPPLPEIAGQLERQEPESVSSPQFEEKAEARQIELDRLYVGMTRARKWLFLIADEDPCDEINKAWEHFDWRRL